VRRTLSGMSFPQFRTPVTGQWTLAAELKPGMWLRTGAGTHVQVTAIKTWTACQRVHNLTIDGPATYWASAGSVPVLVRNDKCPATGISHGRLGEAETYEWLKKSGYADIYKGVQFVNGSEGILRVDFVAKDPNGKWFAFDAKTGSGSEISDAQ